MQRLELSSIWALMAAFDKALPMPEALHGQQLDGAFVEGVNAVSWMANNSQKLTLADKNAPHCWTFFSTGAFGKKNKVPQVKISLTQVLQQRLMWFCRFSTCPFHIIVSTSARKSMGSAGSLSLLYYGDGTVPKFGSLYDL